MFTRNLEELLMQVPNELAQAIRIEMREQQRQEAIETVKCRYDRKRYTARSGDHARAINAELLGLKPIGRGSAFASLVAVHPNFDDMVLKVVPWEDAGAWYARGIRDGKINSIHAPKVFAVHNIDGQAFIYMERLIDVKDFPEDADDRLTEYNGYMSYNNKSNDGIEDSLVDFKQQFRAWNASTGYVGWGTPGFPTDFHMGNVMLRADGTAVFIDPVYSDKRTKSQEVADALAQAYVMENDEFFLMPVKPGADKIIPRHKIYREARLFGKNPNLRIDFMGIDAAMPKKHVICNGKPHAAFIDHNIKRFKR